MKNRSSSEIAPHILELCQGGCRISRVVLNVGLSHAQARAYLSELLSLGFLGLDSDESCIYTTTPDGIRYLQRSQTLLEMLALS